VQAKPVSTTAAHQPAKATAAETLRHRTVRQP